MDLSSEVPIMEEKPREDEAEDEPREDEAKGTAGTEEKTEAQRERADAQAAQLEAQQRGDTGEEIKEFAKEVLADQRQFPDDVAKDATNPERREDEEQGTPTREEHEPEPEA